MSARRDARNAQVSAFFAAQTFTLVGPFTLSADAETGADLGPSDHPAVLLNSGWAVEAEEALRLS